MNDLRKKEYAKRYYQENRERLIQKSKEYYIHNKNKIL